MRSRVHTRLASLALVGLLATSAAGCGDSSSGDDAASDPAPSASASTSVDEASVLTITDPWVKAADTGMTAAFGTLVNSGNEDVVVTSASSDITTAMELHETVQNSDGSMAMQPKKGGFTIPAGGEHELAPGGDHLMIMDLTRAVKPGETVTITLSLEDGSTMDIEATVKNFSGADEDYQNGDMDMDMGASEDSSEGSGGM